MSFTAKELSRELGDPVALYYFRYGTAAASYYAFTDADHNIDAPGSLTGETVTYVPRTLMRASISSSGTLDKSTIEMRAPRSIELSALFLVYPPSQVVICVIRQGHLGETSGDYPAAWAGRIVGFRFELSEAVFSLEPVITSLRRVGLRRNYQFGCPHVLYGDQCQADKPSATIAVNVVSSAANIVTMPANWWTPLVTDVNKFLGGMIQWTTAAGNTEIRTIVDISGGNLIVNGVISNMIAGQQISVILGCNHQAGFADTVGDCKNLHNNINNFGGQPWIPFFSPLGNVSRYY